MERGNTITANSHVQAGNIVSDAFLGKPHSPTPALIACIFWFLAGCSLCGQTSHGTAAIGIWTPSKIVLATDSKVRHVVAKMPDTSYCACKIINVGKFSFAVSGIYDDPSVGYDAWKLAREELGKAKTVSEAAVAVEKAIRPQLEKAVSRLMKNNPSVLSKSYLAFAIAGDDSDSLNLAIRDFVPGTHTALTDVLVEDYPGAKRVGADSIGLSIFGERDAIDRRYPDSALAKLLRSQDITLSAIQLVQLEIESNSSTVGPPRTVLEVSKSGRKWIERGLCETGTGKHIKAHK